MRLLGVAGDGLMVAPPSSCFAAAASSAGLWSPPVDCRRLTSISPDSRSSLFNIKSCRSTGWSKIRVRSDHHRARSLKVRALGSSGDNTPIAPLQFESPTGQLLSQILQTHPHLLPAAIDQQLENLQSDRDAQKEEKPPASQDLLLYRRIAEVKDKERQRVLEEIIYCFIVHKFVDNGITMIPAIAPSNGPAGLVDSWPNQEYKLESIHSPDALEMIRSHLSLVLGERTVGPLTAIIQINKLKLGKLYAASIMYGYFLKRVDERFQLERRMNTLPTSKREPSVFDNLKPNPLWDMESMVQISPEGEFEPLDGEEGGDGKPYRLRSYVTYLDAETLQRYATIRSKQAISLIEKQTQALFGRPDIRIEEDGSLNALNDELVAISFSGLTMLVLEAVAFGSFLWEAEGYVESKYHFLAS